MFVASEAVDYREERQTLCANLQSIRAELGERNAEGVG